MFSHKAYSGYLSVGRPKRMSTRASAQAPKSWFGLRKDLRKGLRKDLRKGLSKHLRNHFRKDRREDLRNLWSRT